MSTIALQRPKKLHQPKPQAGVAVLTALLLVTLLLVTISSLRIQQEVQIRLIENQRMRIQARSTLLGALDYSKLILNEDAKNSIKDDLTEPWATVIAETPVTTYAEKGERDNELNPPTLSGRITDATSRYNLTNLALNRVIDKREVAVLKKLLTNLRQNPELADAIALAVASGQTLPVAPQENPADPNNQNGGGTQDNPTNPNNPNNPNNPSNPNNPTNPTPGLEKPVPLNPTNTPATLTELDDLLNIRGIDPTILESLKNYVIFLPRSTANLITINVNTTTAEVLSARIDTLSLSQAKSIILARDRATFKDLPDFASRLENLTGVKASNTNTLATTTQYFIINGKSRSEKATMETNALVERSAAGIRVIWLREI
jgi:general secretion pathway protein K